MITNVLKKLVQKTKINTAVCKEEKPQGLARRGGAPPHFEKKTISLLKESLQTQKVIKQGLARLGNQNPILDQVIHLSNTVYTHTDQLRQSEEKILGELKKFQLEKSQRAMISVFNKLFIDLLDHMNHLDDLLKNEDPIERDEKEAAWIKALEVLRNQYESVLKEWGCTPIPIKIGEEQFDPEIHEAVESDGESIDPSCPRNVIIQIHRRGWRLHDQILQFPQVIVS